MASQDDPSRLAQWFREFQAPLRRFMGGRRGVPRAELDDLAQEVFLRMLRYDREDFVTDPRGYLFKIAANVASEWFMRARQRLPHESMWLEELIDDTDVVKDIERSERDSTLRAALQELPPRMREILRLHYGEGLKHEAIADRMGVTRRVVKREIIEAYVRLRATLADDDVQTSEACTVTRLSASAKQ
jgi:RNA polymerase sigma-70 factor (ECF subfamily)